MIAAQGLYEGKGSPQDRAFLKKGLQEQYGIEWNDADPDGSLELVAAKVRESRYLHQEKLKEEAMKDEKKVDAFTESIKQTPVDTERPAPSKKPVQQINVNEVHAALEAHKRAEDAKNTKPSFFKRLLGRSS